MKCRRYIIMLPFLTLLTVLLAGSLLTRHFTGHLQAFLGHEQDVQRSSNDSISATQSTVRTQIKHKLKSSSSYMNSSEIHHIGFLKVRKAGGSTMQNIMFRFGLKRNLTFVLPRERYYFDIKGTLPVKAGGHFDILATHSWYNKEQYDKILPPDKVNIAIVREPIDRFISSAFYYRDVWGYNYLRKIPQSNYIEELILFPEKYELNESFSETKNSMGQDFGFDGTIHFSDTDKILTKLKHLEQEFYLVLLMNRFNESLVLMKRYMHWNLSDVLYIPRNTHSHLGVNITGNLRARYKKTSFMDFALFDYFSSIFDKKVKSEGSDFKEEVKYLQNVLEKTASFCTQGNAKTKWLEIPRSVWNEAFKVQPSDCQLMLKEENPFIDELKKRHIRMNKLK